ncbi:uncharacterized protein LOC108292880 [Cebus imitator]|uniref:uncharacterized protein LOC108292880 n=1 Tax=Cebus imitator TaxID=2715852 RepID=UPI001897EFC0|nr:uncharacterized protein LOC108292880 [Cebus imitator]XP_037589209.1 uncharacterized protein LOC108292880 [Cebus imitator]
MMERLSMHSASAGPLYAADGEEATGAGRGSLPSPLCPNKRANALPSSGHLKGETNTIKIDQKKKEKKTFLCTNSKSYSPYSQRQGVEGRGSRQREGDRAREGEPGERRREWETSKSEHQGTAGTLDARSTGPAALGPWTVRRGHQKRDSAKSCLTRLRNGNTTTLQPICWEDCLQGTRAPDVALEALQV